jgi:ABC-type transport system substrate-binding protein
MSPHRREPRAGITALLLTTVLIVATVAGAAGQPAPTGEVVLAWHVTIAPSWFDPSTAPPQITPFGMLYAVHDALVRPYPGHKMGPSLAESWQESEDGKTYQFKLRPGLKFHNGDPVTTEDVKFSFERYKGAGAKALHDRVTQVEIVDPRVVRFHLKEPWPDFMTFYATAEAAVNYLNAVGIRVRIRTVERASFYAAWREKKLRGLFMVAAGNSGNAASRVAEFIYSKGSYAYGGYPDIDDLFVQQARERDVKKREALLHRIQQLTIDRVMFAPIMDLRALMGVGPRVTRHTITDIWMSPFPAYEDMEIKE